MTLTRTALANQECSADFRLNASYARPAAPVSDLHFDRAGPKAKTFPVCQTKLIIFVVRYRSGIILSFRLS